MKREPWEIEHDARILRESQAIKGDPGRLAAAQAYLRSEMDDIKSALGKSPLSKHNNPATVGHFSDGIK